MSRFGLVAGVSTLERGRERGMTWHDIEKFIARLLQTCSETCLENMLDCLKLLLKRWKCLGCVCPIRNIFSSACHVKCLCNVY